MNVQKKKITILGLGVSGLAAALFLKKRGADVFVSDSESTNAVQQRRSQLEEHNISVEIGGHTSWKIGQSDFVVVSPGIKPQSEIYQFLHKNQVTLMSEIELASRFCTNEIIAITGTDGKTTVTHLIEAILKNAGIEALRCGNIGNPFIGEIETLSPVTKVVLEVSSFQLYHTTKFKPSVAVLLNIAPDHLDWHYNFEDYVQAKINLFRNQQTKDHAILNFQDTEIQKFLCKIKAKKIFFNQFPSDLNANKEAALSICDVYTLDKAAACTVVNDFKGVEHRMERVESTDGITYINDSKSTSLHSLIWALESYQKKVILICGGRNKGLDFSMVRQLVAQKVEKAIVIGEAQEDIIEAWQSDTPCIRATSLKEALSAAQQCAKADDVILFSPACSSFDMFENYKDRGGQFKTLVKKVVSAEG